MLIRSQDKKLLINLDNVQTVSICGYRADCKSVYEDEENANTWYITCVCQDYSPFIGYYTSEVKAIEVLDMIQDFYICCQSVLMVNGNINRNLKEAVKGKIGEAELFVFQMPHDEEIEI